MEETRQFIYALISKKKLNIGGCLDLRWIESDVTEESTIIQNNYLNMIELMVDEGILEERKRKGLFLTEQGYKEIYGQ